jgi:hypothetical protein
MSKKQQRSAIYRTKPCAVIVKPQAVSCMNAYLALYDAGAWDDYTLGQALDMEILKGSMLASWESVPIELTGRRSGRCVEFRMRDHEGVWWRENADIIRQRSE